MSLKTQIVSAVVLVLIAFAIGRYTVPIKTVTVEVEKKTTDAQTDQNKHKETTTTEVIKPDGTKETVTKTVEDTKTDRSVTSTDSTNKSTEVTRTGSRVQMSALGGAHLFGSSGVFLSPVFGGEINKEVLGPITAGIWGLSDGTAGISLGLSF